MGKHYSKEFKNQVLNDYKSGNYGGYPQVAKKYGISHGTLSNWIYKEKRQRCLPKTGGQRVAHDWL